MEQDILKTLAYYQALGNMPLSLIEIQRFMPNKQEGENIPLFDIQKSLEHLVKIGSVQTKNGFFYLNNNPHKDPYTARINNLKTTHKKWGQINASGKFLVYIPYIRGVYITGSVALGNASENSDLDILIKTQSSRIWSARFMVVALSMVLGKRRYKNKINNRLCFNQYITEDSEYLGPPNINHIIENIKIPLWSDSKNESRKKSIYNFNANRFGLLVKKTIEILLYISALGWLMEKLIGWMQIKKIQHNETEYPTKILPLTIKTNNLIFYYPSVLETEKKYFTILDSLKNQYLNKERL